MTDALRSARTLKKDTAEVVDALATQFASVQPVAIVFFASHLHQGKEISRDLKARYPAAEIVGCTTAGEYTQAGGSSEGVVALALGQAKVKRCAGALADFRKGVDVGMPPALKRLSQTLSVDLRELDPKRHVGVVLLEGMNGKEEDANEILGNAAPLIPFVGGSAGDNGEFKETRVFYNGEESLDGAALLLMETAVPFAAFKSCSSVPLSEALRVTRADATKRIIYELNHRPVLEVYAEALGLKPSDLNDAIFQRHPFGLMIDGEPWIRSPQQLAPDGGLKFYCRVEEGRSLHVMNRTPLVPETQRAWQKAREALGGTAPSGAVTFNCIQRRMDLDSRNEHAAFLKVFAGSETVGFHTYGESYLGHINQTLTALVFG